MALALHVGCAAATAPPVRARPFEVWRGSHDGYTVRFADALERALASAGFTGSYGNKPGTLVVTIPSELGWEESGGRVRTAYSVVFSDATGRRLGSAKGTCWEVEFASCAARVVRSAEKISRRMR